MRRQAKKCVMCAGEHQVNEHQCGVSGCNKGMGKLCVHVVAQYANCNGNHQANSARCPSRHKAEMQVRKKNIQRMLHLQLSDPTQTTAAMIKPAPTQRKPVPAQILLIPTRIWLWKTMIGLLAPLHHSLLMKKTKALTPRTDGTNVSSTTELWKRV